MSIWTWLYQHDAVIRGARMILKIAILIWLYSMISVPLDNIRYFHNTYDTMPQELFYVDGKGNRMPYNESFILFVPIGVEQGTFAYRWFTEPQLRRDNAIALQNESIIYKYSLIVLLIFLGLFVQDLFTYYYAKSVALNIPYKQCLKEGLIKGLYLDVYLLMWNKIKLKISKNVPKHEEIKDATDNKQDGRNP